MSDEKTRVLKGAFWAFMERFGLQIVGFTISLILSRLLSPDDYGTVALLTIFISVAGCLVDAGFGEALIQKKEATDVDFNTVFYFSIAAALISYLALFLAAPFISSFYNCPDLIPIVRVVSLTLIFNAINSVQRAELSRKLLFNFSFRISLGSAVIAASVGIILAFLGFGPWALVWQGVAGSLVSVVMSWFLIGWRPKLMFSLESLRNLFAFSWKLTLSFLVDIIFGNLSGLLIGKFYSRSDLAFVNKGNSLPNTIMTSVVGCIEKVTYPVLSQMQDDRIRFVRSLRRMLKLSSFFVLPLMVGLIVCTPTLIPLLYGEKWSPAVPFMQFVCVRFALRPFHSVNLRAILALGRSDVFIKLELIKKVIGISLMSISLPYGVMPFMVVSTLVNDPLGVVINAWPNRKLLGYSVVDQIKDVAPSFFVGLIMALSILPLCFLPIHRAIIILVQGLVGAVVYISVSVLFKLDPMLEVLDIIVPKFGTRFAWLVGIRDYVATRR